MALLADIISVVVFCTVGRRSHAEGRTAAGIAETAWPFLAGAFMNWLEGRFRHASDRESGPLQIMYGIDGRECLPEEELAHLEGYMGSAPVRIGNGAATQLQLDVYGELMDSVYLCNKYGLLISIHQSLGGVEQSGYPWRTSSTGSVRLSGVDEPSCLGDIPRRMAQELRTW